LRGHASLVAPASRPRPPQPRLQIDHCLDCLHDLLTPAEWSASSSSSYSYSSSSSSSAARFFPAPRSYAPGPSSSSDDNRAESAPSPPVAPCCSSTASRRPAQRSSLFHATPTPPRYWRAPCAVPQSSWNAEAMSSTVIFAMVFIFVSPLLFAVALRCLQWSSSPWSSFSLVLCYSRWQLSHARLSHRSFASRRPRAWP